MTQQMLRYRQQQPQFVRIKATRNERIPAAALLGGITLALGAPGTAEARPIGAAYFPQTHIGQVATARQEDVNPSEALDEIKQKSGLTWTQLALLMGVSRTTIHDWTSGANLRAGSHAKLSALLERVRSMAELPKFKIRNALLGATSSPLAADEPGPLVVSDNTPARHRPTELVGSMTSS